MTFQGYMRPDGQAGARNMVAVLPTINCLNDAAFQLAREVDGAMPLCHAFVCAYDPNDRRKAFRALTGLGKNPNFAAVLILGTGCEPFPAEAFAAEIAASKKPVLALSVDQQGYDGMMEQGRDFLTAQLAAAGRLQREPCELSLMTFGIKCGGSGALSLLSNNPAVGRAADLLVEQGGSVIFSETSELLGVEAALAKRAVSREVAEKFSFCMGKLKEDILYHKVDLMGSEPNKGNILSGLTTIEEKSLGALSKSGSAPLQDVLSFGQAPTGEGLFFMDCESAGDAVYIGAAAAGAQLGVLSLAGGMPAHIRSLASSGSVFPFYPVLKVLGSSAHPAEEKHFDVCVGSIVDGSESIDAAGERIFQKLLHFASGEKTYTEIHSAYFPTIPLNRTGLIV